MERVIVMEKSSFTPLAFGKVEVGRQIWSCPFSLQFFGCGRIATGQLSSPSLSYTYVLKFSVHYFALKAWRYLSPSSFAMVF